MAANRQPIDLRENDVFVGFLPYLWVFLSFPSLDCVNPSWGWLNSRSDCSSSSGTVMILVGISAILTRIVPFLIRTVLALTRIATVPTRVASVPIGATSIPFRVVAFLTRFVSVRTRDAASLTRIISFLRRVPSGPSRVAPVQTSHAPKRCGFCELSLNAEGHGSNISK